MFAPPRRVWRLAWFILCSLLDVKYRSSEVIVRVQVEMAGYLKTNMKVKSMVTNGNEVGVRNWSCGSDSRPSMA